MTANDILRIATAEIGTTEKPTNKVKYNTWYYGKAVSGAAYPWCMAFVQWVFHMANVNLGLKTASCTALEDYARKNGYLVKKNFRPGDIVFYQFDKDAAADHTGIVESVSGTTITCIEGNTSEDGSQSDGGKVCRKTRKLSLVRSAYRPNYGGYSLTNFIIDVQNATGAKVDGIAGQETLGNTVTISAILNRKHLLVGFIQRRLDALGYNVGVLDGIAGAKFTAAVKAFQTDNGCVVDGEVTARGKTWRKLLGMA